MPADTVCDDGVTATLKSNTQSCAVVVWTAVPLVAVIVNVEVAAGVEVAVAAVNVDVPVPLTVAGEKLPDAPVGRPLKLKETVPANPFWAVIPMG